MRVESDLKREWGLFFSELKRRSRGGWESHGLENIGDGAVFGVD